ncbi:MAG: hypothetical protein M1816_002107 [Peltula sp. TS41687]|nr:MAG: hypothetical protein M1816_002107 [Peltula sp. TS41687]
MKVAEILSDLTSLRVCGPAEALALVRASSSSANGAQDLSTSTSTAATGVDEQDDPELKKVYDLMRLHELVKKGYGAGKDSESELMKARELVDGVLVRMGEEGG